MRPIDADAFDKGLRDAQLECKKNGGNFRYGVLATVRANLEKAPTVGGWISVKDRMPGQNGDYLAYTRDGTVWPYFFMAGVWEDALGNSTDTVTHWMPLPEPPEETKE